MIEVSGVFKDAVYAPVRTASAKVIFELLDNAAYADARVFEADSSPLTRKAQVSDKTRKMGAKWATFEPNYFKLDGTFKIPPKPNDGNFDVGWWSKALSNSAGVFTTPATFGIVFLTEVHSSFGLTITFDDATNIFPVDFDIRIYDFGGYNIIETYEIRGNTSATYELLEGLDDYGGVQLVIHKMNAPYRRARVIEVDYGTLLEYGSDKLIKASLIEQMNVVGDTLPANEIKVTIENTDRDFNILNPEGVYKYLRQRQEITLSLGIETSPNNFEYITTAGYSLVEWQSDEGALTTTLTARNVFDLLEKQYTQTAGIVNLYDLAIDVITQAKVLRYAVDESLRDIPTTGFVDVVTHRKALHCIGVASKSAVYQDRTGRLTVKPFVVLDESTAYVTYTNERSYTGMTTPTVYSGFDMKSISFDNVFREPQIKLDKSVQTLIVKRYVGGTTFDYTFHNPAAVKDGVSLKVDNPLIHTTEQAQDIAHWIFNESNLRALYQVNWRQNPALECGDIVFIEDSFGAKKQSRITKQEYEFAGYLTGKTESKGGV